MDVGLVCDGCSAFNPMGASSCAKCGSGLSLGDAPAPSASQAAFVATPSPATDEPPIQCPSCNNMVPAQNRFCGSCGSHMPEVTRPAASARPPFIPPPAKKGVDGKRTMFFGAMQAARAKLVLIKGDGLDGVSFTLAGDEHIAGRIDAPLLFDEDPFMSPTHANFLYRSGKLVVRDEHSTNGVYKRIHGSTEVNVHDRFLVGEQLLDICDTPGEEPIEPTEDGTYFYASPRVRSSVRLVQVLRGGDTGLAHLANADSITIGREGNDIDFPDDPFISGHHARVSVNDNHLTLTDLDSKNGTFLRVNGECQLEHGDYVFMGQQLLRVEIV